MYTGTSHFEDCPCPSCGDRHQRRMAFEEARGAREGTDTLFALPHGTANDYIFTIAGHSFLIRQELTQTQVAAQWPRQGRDRGTRQIDVSALLQDDRYTLSDADSKAELRRELLALLPTLEQYAGMLVCPHCDRWIGDPENSDIAAISLNHDLDQCERSRAGWE